MSLCYVSEIKPVKLLVRRQNFHLLKPHFCACCQNDAYDGIKRLKWVENSGSLGNILQIYPGFHLP